MDKDAHQSLEDLVRDKLEGKSYSVIRQELRDSGMEEEDIGRLIRQVDERVLQETVEEGRRQRTPQWYRLGLALALGGLLLTIAYKAGIVFPRVPALLIYSPFLAGVIMMSYGKMAEKKTSDPKPRKPGAIRKTRPYK